MKKLFFLLIAAGGTATAIAQGPGDYNNADHLSPRWAVDINLLGGLASQTFTMANTIPNYTNALNMNTGELKYKNGYSYGADAQLSFFFGERRHFGIGTGFLFMEQRGDANLDNYHVEYQAHDGAGNIYRQVVNGNDIREEIVSANINIPLVLKYKTRFSKHWGFAADAGALINLQMKNDYITHASFDYEAIYKFTKSGDGGTKSVYDNSPAPSVDDWLITKAQFLRNNPNGNLQDYFNAKRLLGYSVGEGLSPGTRTGSNSYTQGSVGFILQPSLSYYLSDNTALNFGVYYMFQPFKNNAQSNYRLTEGIGTYSSVLNGITESINHSYGINLGVRFFLGRKHARLMITSIDQVSPSQCGLCDGSITLKGLFPNEPVTVDYYLNGGEPGKYSANVQPDGNVKITGLCAGNYTGIVAKIKKESAMGKPVTLTNPNMRITSQNAVNPTLPGECNGSVTFYGLYAGRSATVDYELNDMTQPVLTGTVNPDNSLTISGLCEGRYTGIMATVNNCSSSVKGTDFTLRAPVPPPPPLPPVMDKPDISTPILFDLNEAVVHESSYPVIEAAAEQLKENKGLSLTIDGHADTTGPESFNRPLSLRRANSVKTQLEKRGINPGRVKTKGHGSRIPAATNTTYEGRQQNRRAVMKIIPAKKQKK